ncbi:MAG: hypothetical protein H3C43_12300, partial [Leptonema sp. (in: Bacteria)]|nr:hypothetical protein [Leptonema sp. (in: bacteria)]
PFPFRGGHIQIQADLNIDFGGTISIELNQVELTAFKKIVINLAETTEGSSWLSRFQVSCQGAKVKVQTNVVELIEFNEKLELRFFLNV